MGKASPQMPGEEAPAPKVDPIDKPKPGTTELNNTSGSTANSVGSDRESVVRAMAQADAARRGVAPDMAPAVEIGAPAEPTSLKRKAIINGVEVEVEVPLTRRNSAVDTFGPESSYPKGTQIRADGKPCEGNDIAVGVVGDINTPQGKLVNRVLRYDAMQPAA